MRARVGRQRRLARLQGLLKHLPRSVRRASGRALGVRRDLRRLRLLAGCGLLIGCAVAGGGRQPEPRDSSDALRAVQYPPPTDAPHPIGATVPPPRAHPPPEAPATAIVEPPPEPVPDIREPLPPLRAFLPQEKRRIRATQNAVLRASRKHGVAACLIDGVIWVESKFDRRARHSPKGARGLMQLMPRTARVMGRRLRRRYRPYNRDFSVDVGTYYLALMLERFQHDTILALAAYQRGPAKVKAWLRAQEPHHPLATIRYVRRVFQAARAFCDRVPKVKRAPGAGFSCDDRTSDAVARGRGGLSL